MQAHSLYEYTLMPAHPRSLFLEEEFEGAELVRRQSHPHPISANAGRRRQRERRRAERDRAAREPPASRPAPMRSMQRLERVLYIDIEQRPLRYSRNSVDRHVTFFLSVNDAAVRTDPMDCLYRRAAMRPSICGTMTVGVVAAVPAGRR